MIGSFGDYIFETTDKRVLTFSGLKRDANAILSEHKRILGKTQVEFNGSEADTISFTINLNGSLGISPREEMDNWIKLVRDGYVAFLIIGGKGLGTNKWIITSVSEAWDVIFNGGELYKGKIDIELKEYVEEVKYVSNAVNKDISRISEEEEPFNANGIVTAKVLNIRENAGVNYKIVGTYKANTNVSIIAKKNGWYKVEQNRYICGQYVKIV